MYLNYTLFQKKMCINETKQLNKHNIYELIQI